MKHCVVILAVLLALAALSGCPSTRSGHRAGLPPHAPVSGDVLDVDPDEAAREVLDTVPDTGRFRAIRRRGALRVCLPPAQSPFQSVHPDLGRPVGFNVALAEQIAKVFGASANVRITGRDTPPGTSCDITFCAAGAPCCSGPAAVKYFMRPGSHEWLFICAAQADPALKQALHNTLDYFTENGMFTYLYTEYFP